MPGTFRISYSYLIYSLVWKTISLCFNFALNLQDSKYPVCVSLKDLTPNEMMTYKQFLPELDLLNSTPIIVKQAIGCKTESGLSPPSKSQKSNHSGSTSPHPPNSGKSPAFDDLHGILSCVSLMKSDGPSSNSSANDERVEKSSHNIQDKDVDCFYSSDLNPSDCCQTPEERQRISEFLKAFKFPEVYLRNAQSTKHAAPFAKVAFSDMNAEKYVRQLEPLLQRDSAECRLGNVAIIFLLQ